MVNAMHCYRQEDPGLLLGGGRGWITLFLIKLIFNASKVTSSFSHLKLYVPIRHTSERCIGSNRFLSNYRPHTKYGGRYCFHRHVSFTLCPRGWEWWWSDLGGWPRGRSPPPKKADGNIVNARRYASYWNAFLLRLKILIKFYFFLLKVLIVHLQS